ncbi:DDHD domain-containing protein [Phascolomyces articulosus]|uniref:DDHD domain-containing protein n=1 Tax=Phascolomyces articulosus TaxID=60185 RepID=A0AAD5K2K8_9FUNG|nr:DDHD domain-containing protein [Phascolomyces articulosus]
MIPIEWHRHIHSETDEWVHRVMPKNIPTVRLIESDYLSDVMYYFTKERGQSIINHVTKSFNQSYHDFMEQQPNFNGKISILGYSLGGLITWDILSHQRQDLTTQEMEQLTKFDVKVPKLDFKPDYLFGMGCPLAGLLIARNQDPRYYHPDYSTVFENIYHPMDPLAFRLEPLLNHEFEEPPVALERAIAQQPTSFASLVFSLFRGTSTTTNNTSSHSKNIPGGTVATQQQGGIMMMSPEKESMVVMPTPSLSATPTSSCPTTAPQTPTAEQHETPLLSKNDSHCWKMIDLDRMDDDEEDATTKIPLPLGRRYDYELTPDSYLGMISNEYILGLRAHFSYWTNKDMHWHIFCRMEGIDH